MSKPVAIITGAGKGIGRATAIELAARGYDLVVTARTQGDLDETIKQAGTGIAIPADVSRLEDVERVVAETSKRFGRIDALVNNAGYAPVRSIAQMTTDEWRQVIDTNLSATFYFCRAVFPIMKQGGGGAIVNISSMSSRDPFMGLGAYGAAKAGVNILSLALAREGEPHNIAAYTVAPGAVETGMFRQLLTKDQYPPSKTLEPADVAKVIAQCICGDLKHSAGEVIYVHKRLK